MDRSNNKSSRPKQRAKSASIDASTESVVLGYPEMEPTPHRFNATPSGTGAKPSQSTASTTTPSHPPMPKRAKGRLFIGTALLLFIGYSATYFYDSFVRYAAYGEVVGRRIELAAPWNGVVTSVHVREGDSVRQGDPIFRIDSLEMRHRMEQIEDTLNFERARLSADLAKLKWEAERVEDDQELVKADYYEKWSELLWEQSVLADLRQKLARSEKLNALNAVADESYASIRLQVDGQESRTRQLSEAVESLQHRFESDRPLDPALNDQIKPSIVRIENLLAELRRVRKVLDQGLVTSPVNGRVTRIATFAGEYADESGPVIELFVDGSTEIVIYLPQDRSLDWSIGDHMCVSVDPTAHNIDCEVVRLAPGMQRAPQSIDRYYDSGEALLPLIVRPSNSNISRHLILGSKVRLPRENKSWHLKNVTAWLAKLKDTNYHELRPDEDQRRRPFAEPRHEFPVMQDLKRQHELLATHLAQNTDSSQTDTNLANEIEYAPIAAKIAKLPSSTHSELINRYPPTMPDEAPTQTLRGDSGASHEPAVSPKRREELTNEPGPALTTDNPIESEFTPHYSPSV